MKNSLFCGKDLIKYLIIFGLIYSILKMIPSEQLTNKDLVLIMVIIGLGLISIDCLFNKKYDDSEDFANIQNQLAQTNNSNEVTSQQIAKSALDVANRLKALNINAAQLDQVLNSAQTVSQSAIDLTNYPMPILPEQISQPVQFVQQPTQPVQYVQQPTQPVQYIQQPTQQVQFVQQQPKQIVPTQGSKVTTQSSLPKTACSAEIDVMKKNLEAQINELKKELQTDSKYNELPLDMYQPIGKDIANKWETDNEYTILNTNQWQVPMPRPPVCVNTAPCKVCPTDAGGYFPVKLKDWDEARTISETNINKKWAADHVKK